MAILVVKDIHQTDTVAKISHIGHIKNCIANDITHNTVCTRSLVTRSNNNYVVSLSFHSLSTVATPGM